MTSDEFIAWAMEQPEGRRCELVAGEVVAMAPERTAHTLTKFRITRRLAEAVEREGLACQVFPDGMAVEVDATTIHEPDALVRCGPPMPDDAVKLADYFRLPSVRHYLLVRTEDRVVIHHARNDDGTILTRIVRDGPIRLDPPGLLLTDLFPAGH